MAIIFLIDPPIKPRSSKEVHVSACLSIIRVISLKRGSVKTQGYFHKGYIGARRTLDGIYTIRSINYSSCQFIRYSNFLPRGIHIVLENGRRSFIYFSLQCGYAFCTLLKTSEDIAFNNSHCTNISRRYFSLIPHK